MDRADSLWVRFLAYHLAPRPCLGVRLPTALQVLQVLYGSKQVSVIVRGVQCNVQLRETRYAGPTLGEPCLLLYGPFPANAHPPGLGA